MRLKNYSYNYKLPKLIFQNCNYNYIYYYRAVQQLCSSLQLNSLPKMERRFQYYMPFTNHMQYIQDQGQGACY